jgi:hypothetical protein
MKYVLTIGQTAEVIEKAFENIEEAKKEIRELIEQVKPEAMYVSTIRRLMFIVVNIEDPHVELRRLFENLSKWGNVTVDPVSTLEEFGAYIASL